MTFLLMRFCFCEILHCWRCKTSLNNEPKTNKKNKKNSKICLKKDLAIRVCDVLYVSDICQGLLNNSRQHCYCTMSEVLLWINMALFFAAACEENPQRVRRRSVPVRALKPQATFTLNSFGDVVYIHGTAESTVLPCKSLWKKFLV